MKVRPLTGQVLVELIPEETTFGGVLLSPKPLSADEVQERSRDPDKPPGRKAKVLEIGPWPKLKSGLVMMPEYGKGSLVIIGSHAGRAIERGTRWRLRVLKQSDVLAVLM